MAPNNSYLESFDSTEGGAMYFSLQQTARANGLDPEKYVAKAIELTAFMSPEKETTRRFCRGAFPKNTI